MTNEEKEKAKKEFADIVNKEIDVLFDKPLTNEEADSIIVQEVSDLVSDMATMNNINSALIQDTADALNQIKVAESGVSDVKKIIEVKQSLGLDS